MNFCVAILILKMEENKWHFQHILYYFKKGKNTIEAHTHKIHFVKCMEKLLWLIEHVKSGSQSFVLEISRWTVFHDWVDQLKLIAIESRY